ncbi:hypothetical protein CXG81DRAFT_16425 [Caulochytrium protostelioides]|uniref:Ribosomal protein mS38 C-terminal domain-containing protein n=1 Tax=Caulochytrium protostelioides TaxID=1555241 RepID=A0A4P9XF08_9FUNG|nr:hypothetical protein CXG81DRAFT_16425 [Caulochytrium protostelioides]|eukprot:RKP04142.1 hypothetical protein CXG81DRAFT_16425 [Caulochytrium protostelioides]
MTRLTAVVPSLWRPVAAWPALARPSSGLRAASTVASPLHHGHAAPTTEVVATQPAAPMRRTPSVMAPPAMPTVAVGRALPRRDARALPRTLASGQLPSHLGSLPPVFDVNNAPLVPGATAPLGDAMAGVQIFHLELAQIPGMPAAPPQPSALPSPEQLASPVFVDALLSHAQAEVGQRVDAEGRPVPRLVPTAWCHPHAPHVVMSPLARRSPSRPLRWSAVPKAGVARCWTVPMVAPTALPPSPPVSPSVVPMTQDGAATDATPLLAAWNIMRIRRKKMNRHKWKKRRRATRHSRRYNREYLKNRGKNRKKQI